MCLLCIVTSADQKSVFLSIYLLSVVGISNIVKLVVIQVGFLRDTVFKVPTTFVFLSLATRIFGKKQGIQDIATI